MTFNPPGFRTVMLLAFGFGLKSLSNVLERAGDLAGDPGVRLFNHLSASCSSGLAPASSGP